MKYSRRDLSLLVPAIAAAATAAAADKPILPAKTWKYEDLPVKQNGQNEGRAVFDGATHSNFPVELHITKLGPGQQPHPPHHHVHEEVVTLRSGVLDVTISGETTRLTPGSVAYVASGLEHGWKNPSPTEHTEYFVIALGQKS